MRPLLLTLGIALAFIVADTATAQSKQNPCNPCAKKMAEETNFTGEIIDVKCYTTGMQGGRGADHEECAIACIKGGLPVGLLDEKSGVVYVLTPAKGMKGANEALLSHVAQKVTVKGKVSEKGGAKVLLYTSVESVR